MLRAIACVALLAMPLATAAEDAQAAASLSVRPLLCIVDSRTRVCAARFLIAWQTAETGYYCVTSDRDTEPLRCWTERRAGELEDDREVQADLSYRLTRGGDEPPLASATVEVLRMDSDDRRRNRRTRHVWDVL